MEEVSVLIHLSLIQLATKSYMKVHLLRKESFTSSDNNFCICEVAYLICNKHVEINTINTTKNYICSHFTTKLLYIACNGEPNAAALSICHL